MSHNQNPVSSSFSLLMILLQVFVFPWVSCILFCFDSFHVIDGFIGFSSCYAFSWYFQSKIHYLIILLDHKKQEKGPDALMHLDLLNRTIVYCASRAWSHNVLLLPEVLKFEAMRDQCPLDFDKASVSMQARSCLSKSCVE